MKKVLLLGLIFIQLSSFAQNRMTLPLFENFDSYTITETPTDWTLETENYNWMLRDFAYFSPSVSLTIPFHDTEEKKAWVFTPGLDMEQGKMYILQFMLEAPGWDGIPEALELGFGDAAASSAMSEIIWSDNNLMQSDYVQMTFAVTPTETGTFYFGWHAFSAPNVDYISIDDVHVFEAPETDVNLFDSKLPESVLLGLAPETVLIVENLGSQAVSFDVNLSVIFNETEVYYESVNVANLTAIEKLEISFPEFTPDTEGDYTFVYTTTVANDANIENNTLTKVVHVVAGCEHHIKLTAPGLESGWYGASISITSDGIPVLTNITMDEGALLDFTFPSSEGAVINLEFDALGDLPEDCFWAVYDGENNLLLEGNGESLQPVSQTTTGNCPDVSIQKLSDIISVFPNPTTGSFTVTSNENVSMQILDITGKLLKKTSFIGTNTFRIETAGVYFLKFSNETGASVQRVIVK